MTTPSLPTPGGDADTWGTELNTFLSVSLNPDGTIKPGAVPDTDPDPDVFVTSVNQRTGDVTLSAADVAGGASGTAGQFLQTDGQGNGSWKTPSAGGPAGGVASVNARTGAVVLTAADVAAGAVGTYGQVLQTDGQGHGFWGTVSTGGGSGGGTTGPWAANPDAVFVKPIGGGADDTANVISAINTAVTDCISKGTFFAEVWLQPGTYVIGAPPTQGAPTYGNAQIPLPLIPPANQKVILSIRSFADASAFPYWEQTMGIRVGAVLYSTATGTNDSQYGPTCVLGGPNGWQGYGNRGGGGMFGIEYSNMLIYIDGISVVSSTLNPTVAAFDFSGVSQMHVGSCGAFVDSAPLATSPGVGDTLPTNGWTFGLYPPTSGNNDVNIIENFSVEGYYNGVRITEHTNAFRLGAVYNTFGIVVMDNGGGVHGNHIYYATVEACPYSLYWNASNQIHLHFDMLDLEPVYNAAFSPVWDISDNNTGSAIGYVGVLKSGPGNPNANSLLIQGCSNLEIKSEQVMSHTIMTPADNGSLAVPPSGTMLGNPLWRNAMVYVIGGSVTRISVNCGGRTHDTGTTSGAVLVPSGASIALYYTSPPTWTWCFE